MEVIEESWRYMRGYPTAEKATLLEILVFCVEYNTNSNGLPEAHVFVFKSEPSDVM